MSTRSNYGILASPQTEKRSRSDADNVLRPDTRKVILMQDNSTRAPYFPKNLNDYAPWVVKYGLTSPYGECQCGCGRSAPIANRSRSSTGLIANHPVRYLPNHHRRPDALENAFWKYAIPGNSNECWTWQGYIGERGYGQLKFKCATQLAHRVSWIVHFGPIPNDLNVLHKCDNPPCWNPEHLFLGTNLDNIIDKVNKGRQAHSEKHGRAKLANSQIPIIYELKQSGLSDAEIAERFDVSRVTIYNIVLGKKWQHVERLKQQRPPA